VLGYRKHIYDEHAGCYDIDTARQKDGRRTFAGDGP
jgi:hypothetical protein